MSGGKARRTGNYSIVAHPMLNSPCCTCRLPGPSSGLRSRTRYRTSSPTAAAERWSRDLAENGLTNDSLLCCVEDQDG
eukprot:scaffold81100_cov36-Tisochrysis_lutea.AAC.1